MAVGDALVALLHSWLAVCAGDPSLSLGSNDLSQLYFRDGTRSTSYEPQLQQIGLNKHELTCPRSERAHREATTYTNLDGCVAAALQQLAASNQCHRVHSTREQVQSETGTWMNGLRTWVPMWRCSRSTP